MVKVKILRPCLGHEIGAVVVLNNVGVARTLISFGACAEVKDDEPKLDADENVKPKRSSRKPRRSKKSS